MDHTIIGQDRSLCCMDHTVFEGCLHRASFLGLVFILIGFVAIYTDMIAMNFLVDLVLVNHLEIPVLDADPVTDGGDDRL